MRGLDGMSGTRTGGRGGRGDGSAGGGAVPGEGAGAPRDAVGEGPPGAGAELLRETAAEWVRQSSLRSTWWVVAVALAGMAVFAALMGYTELTRILENPDEADGAAFMRLTSQGHYYLVQFAVLILAALASTGEFANRSVTSTLLWRPRRGVVLAARTLVSAGLAFAVGVLSTLVGVAVLAGFVAPYAGVDVPEAAVTALSAGLCMALFAVLFTGVGTALRSMPGTITLGFLVLLGLPMVMQLSQVQAIGDAAALMPGLAGIEFYAGGDVGFYTAPYDGPVNILAVVGWAVAAQIVARTELRVRDV
ncbi:ABC transporter permease [Nocardiopsis sp. NPDC101807]|uniref:ABC transporter permease n=1 Tax=Nocardiopsis sp. NPDC101807 TaxID=3364339 RepID=UPI00380FC08C